MGQQRKAAAAWYAMMSSMSSVENSTDLFVHSSVFLFIYAFLNLSMHPFVDHACIEDYRLCQVSEIHRQVSMAPDRLASDCKLYQSPQNNQVWLQSQFCKSGTERNPIKCWKILSPDNRASEQITTSILAVTTSLTLCQHSAWHSIGKQLFKSAVIPRYSLSKGLCH